MNSSSSRDTSPGKDGTLRYCRDVQLFANGAALTRPCSITFSFVALPCETPKSVKPLTVSRAFSTFSGL